MLKKLLIGFVALFLVLVGYLWLQPSAFHIERSRSMKAPPEVVYAHIDDYTSFLLWSPWQKYEPTAKTTLSGAESGVGAVYEWEGKEVGKGRMEILEAKPNESIKESLDFIEPFPSKATVVMTLVPEAGGTKVTWSYDTENGFMAKLFGVFVDMDEMLGKDFADGLASLAELSEIAALKATKAAEEAAAPDGTVPAPEAPVAPVAPAAAESAAPGKAG